MFMATAALASSAARPVVVGLTGSIGMGKSTASRYFAAAGFRVHDADAVVHSLYAAGGAAVGPVCAAFPGVEAAGGGNDRSKLSAAVATAGRDASLKTLESIVHPLVSADRDAFVARAAAEGEWLIVLDIPLLMETMDGATRSTLLDALVVVSAPADVQRERVLSRPGMTSDKLDFILTKQVADADKRAAADYVIETGHESFAPARAQLARCLADLSTRHAARYATWRDQPVSSPKDVTPCKVARVRGVSFDLDDTLFPTMPPIMAASQTLATAIEREMPNSFAAGAAERSALRGSMKAVSEEQPLLAHDFTELRRVSLQKLARAHGDKPSDVDRVVDTFVRARSNVRQHFYPEVPEALKAVRAAGLPVGSLTNGNCNVRAHEEVSEWFDFAITAADCGASKPHPVPFWIAAAAATHAQPQARARAQGAPQVPPAKRAHDETEAEQTLKPRHLVHIGDDVSTDLLGALAAGCRAVLISRPELAPRPPEQTALLPAADPSRWREVGTVDEAIKVVMDWRSDGEEAAKVDVS